MIRGIHHVAVNTARFDEMRDFYVEAFGFEPMEEMSWSGNRQIDGLIGVSGSAARTVMMKAGNCYFELFEYAQPAPGRFGPLDPNDRGYTHFCIDVTDIETEFARLSAVGMTFPEPAPGDLGGVKMIYGRDPDGNVIEIQELPVDYAAALDRVELRGAGGQDAGR